MVNMRSYNRVKFLSNVSYLIQFSLRDIFIGKKSLTLGVIACVTTHFAYNTVSLQQPQLLVSTNLLTNLNERNGLIQTVFQSQYDMIDDLETHLFYIIGRIFDRSKILLHRNLKVYYLLFI